MNTCGFEIFIVGVVQRRPHIAQVVCESCTCSTAAVVAVDVAAVVAAVNTVTIAVLLSFVT